MGPTVLAHPLLECLHQLKTHFFTKQPPLLTAPTVSKHFFSVELKSISLQSPLCSPILAITISYRSFIIMRGKVR